MTNSTAPRRFRFNAKYLKALQAFKAKNDVRFYLTGFLVKPAENGNGVILCATNGHVMVVIHDKDGHSNGKYIIKPSTAFFKEGAKKGRKSDPNTVPDYIEAFGSTLAIISEQGATEYDESALFEFTETILYAEFNESINGKFPSYERVLKSDFNVTSDPIGLNPAYLTLLSHLCPDKGNDIGMISMMTNGQNNHVAFRSQINPEMYAILMPMHQTYNTQNFYPDFLPKTTEQALKESA